MITNATRKLAALPSDGASARLRPRARRARADAPTRRVACSPVVEKWRAGKDRDVSRRRPPSAREARARSGGIGRTSSPHAEQVSDDLRLGHGGHLPARRRQAALLVLASASLGVVSLYQLGLVKHLPEPPLRFLDADRVDASGEAYWLGLTPDATLGIASSAASLALVGMGTADRAHTQPIIPMLAAAKLALDAVGGAYLTIEQISKHRRLCSWCLVAAVAQAAAVPLALPEAREALQRLHR